MNDTVLHSQHITVEAENGSIEQSIEKRKQQLTSRFLVFGMIGVLTISILLSLGGYFRLQVNELSAAHERVHGQLEAIARSISAKSDASQKRALEAMGTLAVNRISHVKGVKIFSADGKLIWFGGNHAELKQTVIGRGLSPSNPSVAIAPQLFSTTTLLNVVTGNFKPSVFASILPLQRKPIIVLVSVGNQNQQQTERYVALRLMLFLILSTSLLFALLYVTFLRGIKTIEEQEQKLNKQISSLSNLLTINKSMQRSIRTASARAVELNEQFLRRVGADLHDGPAQMIGFSVMRLNQALDKDESGLIGPEFHAIKQALEESLEEIRGISSGLVLPELESMDLEQCMRKVVVLHTAVNPVEVAEFYQDIERDIPLPIKICAYRFVQEGLNNAQKHGQAQRCKLTVNIKNDALQITLKDNGVGFRKSQLTNDGKHLGLVGLKDRIESLGGRLAINSELGVGTTLKLKVSLLDQ